MKNDNVSIISVNSLSLFYRINCMQLTITSSRDAFKLHLKKLKQIFTFNIDKAQKYKHIGAGPVLGEG